MSPFIVPLLYPDFAELLNSSDPISEQLLDAQSGS